LGDAGRFFLAAANPEVGLGNIWRFPYMTGDHGGAAFLAVCLFPGRALRIRGISAVLPQPFLVNC